MIEYFQEKSYSCFLKEASGGYKVTFWLMADG